MKIARIVPFLDYGGIEKVIEIASLEFLKYQKLKHTVVVLGLKGRTARELESHGVEVICLNKNPRIPNLILINDLITLFRSRRFDIVHTAGAEANFHGIIAGTLAGVKIRIGEEIGFPNHHLVWRIIFMFIYSMANKVIVVSEAVKKNIIGKGELSEKKVKVIFNPAKKPSNIRTEKKKKEVLTFIMVCRVTAIKNIPATIRAFARLHFSYQDMYKLVIVGDGDQKTYLEKLIVEMGLENTICLAGYQRDVSNFLYEADVFMIPSISEGSSVSLTEAMLHGLPAIVTLVGGASEIIGDSESAIFVDPENITEITKAIEYFLNLNEADLEMMGIRAKQFAGSHFSPRKYATDLLTLYKNPF